MGIQINGTTDTISAVDGTLDINQHATFGGNVTIGGTITYEDATSIDSVGIITARDDIKLTKAEGQIEATGATGLTLNASHGSAYARIRTAGSERLRIDSSGRLLIGTTTEGYASADDLTVATTGNTGITIRSSTGGLGTLAFSDGTTGAAEYDGYIQYSQADQYMDFGGAGGNIRLRIASDGDIHVGGTARPTPTVSGFVVENNGKDVRWSQGGGTSGTDLAGLSIFGGGSNTNVLATASWGSNIALHNTNNTDGNSSCLSFCASTQLATSFVIGETTSHSSRNGELVLATSSGAAPTEKLRIGSAGQIGLSGANYGSSGQVLTSQGSGSAAAWSTISGTTINSNTNNYLITGTGTANTLQGESALTFDGSQLVVQGGSGTQHMFRHSAGWGGVTSAGSAGGSGSGFSLANNYSGTLETKWSIYLDGSTDALRFTSNTPDQTSDERLRITADGKFIQGATSTNTNTIHHVEGSAASGAEFIGNNSAEGFYLALQNKNTNTNAYTAIQSWDAGGQIVASQRFIQVNNSNNQGAIAFRTRHTGSSEAERMRIHSTGQIRIGDPTGSPQTNFDVVRNSASTLTDAMLVKGNVGNGFIRFQDNDNSCNWTLGADDGSGIGANGFVLYDRVNSAYRWSVDNGGNMKVWSGNVQMANGQGIDFSATGHTNPTGDGEVLTNYEEGTWTPQPMFSGANTGMAFSADGYYVRVGKMVSCFYQIIFTNKGSATGDFQIGGFPFSNSATEFTNPGFGYFHRLAFSESSDHVITCNLSGTTSSWRRAQYGSGPNMATVTHSHLSNSTHLAGSLIYRTS